MANDRIRNALLHNRLTPRAVAQRLGVDPKTAERWVTQGRAPYPRHRHAIAATVLNRKATSCLTQSHPNGVRVSRSQR
jgi:hypothetical protein